LSVPLIVAGKGLLSVFEGCTAPMFDTQPTPDAAVVEFGALDDATIK